MGDGEQAVDFAIVGGGPVGLHAALKCALLGHTAAVIDAENRLSRAFFVPKVYNIPASAEPLPGREIMARQRAALAIHGELVKIIENTRASGIRRLPSGYSIECIPRASAGPSGEKKSFFINARCVILATGNIDRQPEIGGTIKTILPYADKGIVYYCILCDGHLLKGRKTAVIGSTDYAGQMATHAARFAAQTTILTNGKAMFSGDSAAPEQAAETKAELGRLGVKIVEHEISGLFGLREGVFGVKLKDGSEHRFDRALCALGFYKIGNELAVQMGAQLDPDGFVVTDGDCRIIDRAGNSIPGLYAAGDVTTNWKQLPVGWGDAEKAVIHAHLDYLW